MIDEYSREKAEAETEAEAMMRDKAKVINRARAEEEAKARAEEVIIKQVWREKSLGAKTRRVKSQTKSAVNEAQERAKSETDKE